MPLGVRCQTGEPLFRVGGGVSAPKALNHPDPEYSEEARNARLEGTCVLSVVVNKKGNTENIGIVRSLGMGLDEKAIEAIQAWTFKPALKDGKPVAVLIRIAVSFRLGNASGAGFSPALQDLRRMDEERRRLEDRVYQVQGTAPPPVCNQNRRNDDASFSLPELKGDVSKYHLNAIKFTNNKTLTNVEALRKLFPLRDGEPLDHCQAIGGFTEPKASLRQPGICGIQFCRPINR
jgi:TonB family protein